MKTDGLDKKMKEYLHECTLSVIYTPVGPKNPFCLFYLTELCCDYNLFSVKTPLQGCFHFLLQNKANWFGAV
jgi:hypothetical protein